MHLTQTFAAVAALSAVAIADANLEERQNFENFAFNRAQNGGNHPTQTARVGAQDKAATFPTSINFGNFGGQGGQNGQRPTFSQGGFSGPKGVPTSFPQQGGRPAFSAVPAAPAKGGCPAIWTQISKDLTAKFSDNGQCTDLARAAIRIAFHDCGSWDQSQGNNAGCDGSIYLAKEYTRSENAGMQDTIPQLGAMAQQYGVGVADFFQFAGAHAVVTCPLGPTVQTFVGRKDRSTANPEGLLPNARSNGDTLFQNMAAKGFTATEVAALIGAHTSAKQFVTDPARAGAALDSTPGVWDVKFYSQVLDGSAPFILDADKALSQQSQVGPIFKRFVNDQSGWNSQYAPAMTKMSLFGVDRNGLIDCTSALPPPRFKTRREVIGHIAPHLLVTAPKKA